MDGVLARLEKLRILPILTVERAEDAETIADALLAGGLPCAEVTFRTAAAEESIRRMAARKDLLLGAGTILSVELADRAIAAGARFLVTPGFNAKVVAHAAERKIPIFPGTATPTDLEAALEAGLTAVKFFPAEPFGGVKTLQALSAPYRMMKFVPTGGIDASNLKSYLALPCVLAVGGSWMVKSAKFDDVTRLAREAVALAAR
jgi:2-dehydro-3-deoxyphosphogluconate aldolase/(4S)-4-hydroxy-2-oxoglutarate aldolase